MNSPLSNALKVYHPFSSPLHFYLLVVLAGQHIGRGDFPRIYPRGSVVIDHARLDLHFANKFKHIEPKLIVPLANCPELLTEDIMAQADWIDIASDWLDDHEYYENSTALRSLKVLS